MQSITFKSAGAQTDSATGGELQVEGNYSEAVFILDVTALATETADKLDVFIDVSPDNGTTWLNAVHFTQLSGDGSATKEVAKITKGVALNDPDAVLAVTSDAASGVTRNLFIGNKWRYRSTITDATTDNASFTYSLVGVFS